MGWRTIFIVTKQHIRVKNNNLLIESLNEEIIKFPLEEIDTIVIDNFQSNVSIPTMLEITRKNISLIVNDEKHMPTSLILPMSGHYRPLRNFSKQIHLLSRKKKIAQKQIIQQKIKNQRNIMEDLNVKDELIEKMELYEKQVNQGDERNREAVAAKLFFRSLYTSSFVRFSDDPINKSINYGYKILASRISSSIVKYGLNPSLGFFHKNDQSYFNLTYDLMEPFRPLIDWITVQNNEILGVDELNFKIRIELIKVLDYYVQIDGKTMKVKNAIDYMVKSVVSYLHESIDDICLPEIYGEILRDYENDIISEEDY